MQPLFGNEFSAIPPVLFDEYNNHISLEPKLMNELRIQASPKGKLVEVLISDAGTLLWHIHWPKD